MCLLSVYGVFIANLVISFHHDDMFSLILTN